MQKSFYNTEILLKHRNPVTIQKSFYYTEGLGPARLGPGPGPGPAPGPAWARAQKTLEKNIKSLRKQVCIKDDRKSSSEKLRRVVYYLFYIRDPPNTYFKLFLSKKMSNARNIGKQIIN